MDARTQSLLDMLSFYRYVENNYPVDQWKIDGVHIWPHVRLKMMSVGRKDGRKQETAAISSNKWIGDGEIIFQVTKNSIIQAVRDGTHREKIRRADVVLWGDGVGRALQMPNGSVFDVYLGGVRWALEKEGFDTFKFEGLQGLDYKSPYFDSAFLIDPIIVKYMIKRKILGAPRDVEVLVDGYEEMLADFVRNGFDKTKMSLENIIREILWIQNLAKEFLAMLHRIRPRIVIVENWRSSYAMALLLAAKKQGIPSVDVQYAVGAEDELHPGYFPWSNIPTGGYDLMPDYLWVWSKADYENVAKWSKDNVKPFIGGAPMNLFWHDPENKWHEGLQKEYETLFASDKPAILFALQWGMAYPQWVLDFIYETSGKYNWLLRMHPVVDDGQRLFIEKVKIGNEERWKRLSEFPLAILLQNVSLQVTMNSSTVIEAEQECCPSIIMDYQATIMFAGQMKRGIARYTKSREELAVAIENILSCRDSNRTDEERAGELYAQGRAGIRRLIKIMESSQPCYTAEK